MLKLLLVRHGESLADIEMCHEGRADYPLTKKGELQASLLAKYLKEKYEIDDIFCSPLKRAYCTAQKIGQEFNMNLKVKDDLMEMNNGFLAGLTYKEAQVKYPLPTGGRKIYDPIPGGESIIEFRMRVEKFWNKFLDENYKSDEKKCLCIIAHGGTISMLNKAIFRLPVDTEIKFPTGDTGFHEWIIKNDERYIVRMNCQEHLCNNIYEKYE